MKSIEEWDEIMFGLLEGEITGDEKTNYLTSILSDEQLAIRWEQWQQTTFHQETLVSEKFIKSLKKEEDRKVISWFSIGIAASIALLAILVFNIPKEDQAKDSKVIATAPLKGPLSIPNVETVAKNTPENAKVSVPIQKEQKKVQIKNVVTPRANVTLHREKDVTELPILDEIKSIVLEDKKTEKINQDSTMVIELRNVIAQKQRARGDDILVFIEDKSSSFAKNTEDEMNGILKNYEMAGKRTRYSIIKEECEVNLYCYTLVIENNQNKTYFKL